MWNDRELLAALQRGDQDAWDEAFRRLYPAAFAAARHPLASLTPSEAEDIAIEALTLLLPKIKKVAAFDEKGRPAHQRGVSAVPGLYFLGLPWLSRRASAFIWGVWRDAEYLADHIAARNVGCAVPGVARWK